MSRSIITSLSLLPMCLLMSQVACRELPDDQPSQSNSQSGTLEGRATKAPLPFLTAKDLKKPTSTAAIEASEIPSKLKDLSYQFIANSGPETEDPENAPSQACMDQVVNSLKAKVIGRELYIDGELDFAPCLSAMSMPQITYETLKIRFYTQVSCDDQDLSRYDGMGMKDLGKADLKCVKQMLTHEQTQTVSKIRFAFDGGEKIIESQSIHSLGTADQKACVKSINNGINTYQNTCELIERETQIEDGVPIAVNYQKLAYRDLSWKESKSQTWYESGSIDLTVNDWTGQVQFTAADIAPTYTLKNGDLTASGQVQTYSLLPRNNF